MEDCFLCPDSGSGVLARTEADPEPAGDLALALFVLSLERATSGVGCGMTPHSTLDIGSLGGRLENVSPATVATDGGATFSDAVEATSTSPLDADSETGGAAEAVPLGRLCAPSACLLCRSASDRNQSTTFCLSIQSARSSGQIPSLSCHRALRIRCRALSQFL